MVPPLNLNNQQFAQGQQAAQQIKANQVPTGPAAIMQQGARAGAVAQAAQTQQAVQQAGKQVIEAQNVQARQDIAKQEARTMDKIEAQRALTSQKRRLAKFAQEMDNNMMEERRDFSAKKRGQAFNNERQLADWTISNSRNEIQLNNRLREIQQASSKKIKTLELIQQRIMLEEEQLSRATRNAKNRKQKIKLAKMKAAMEEKIRREREKARKKGGLMKQLIGYGKIAVGTFIVIGSKGSASWAGGSLIADGAGDVVAGREEAN